MMYSFATSLPLYGTVKLIKTIEIPFHSLIENENKKKSSSVSLLFLLKYLRSHLSIQPFSGKRNLNEKGKKKIEWKKHHALIKIQYVYYDSKQYQFV